MDFRSMCQKIDVDSLKAKLPALPSMPALPQLKLPKLKSRKIFRSSCENVNETDKNLPRSQTATSITQQQAAPIPRAEFIDYTPKHISTISSLMHGYSIDGTDSGKKNTYRSACSVDDDYPSSAQQPSCNAASSRTSDPITPMPPSKVNLQELPSQQTASSNNTHWSITERIQKSYKDVSEFRIKHIFAKKTVVRKDNIQVADYVLQYDAERLQEQAERERYDRDIADNYNINFKLATTRQNTIESGDSLDVTESSLPEATASAELGYNINRETNELPAHQSDIATGTSSTKGKASLTKTSISTSDGNLTHEKKTSKFSSEYKNRLRRLKSYLSTTDENKQEDVEANQSTVADADTKPTKMNREESLHKSKESVVSQKSVEQVDSNEKPLSSIKQNLKRFHKSLKRSQFLPSAASETNEPEDKNIESERPMKSTRHENLRSSKSVEEISGQSESRGLRKLQTWKTSLEKQASRAVSGSIIGFKNSPTQPHHKSQDIPNNGLMKKIKCICSRKTCNPNEENSDFKRKEKEESNVEIRDECGMYSPSDEQVGEESFREINEKFQQSPVYHKSYEYESSENIWSETAISQNRKFYNIDDEHEKEEVVCVLLDDDDEPEPITGEHCFTDISLHDMNESDIREYASIESKFVEKRNCKGSQLAAWTTKSMLCERSPEADADSKISRVFLHQDSSDAFESTLFVTVTRPESGASLPKLTEIIPEEHMPISPAESNSITHSKSINSIPIEHTNANYFNKKHSNKLPSNKQLEAHNETADSNSDLTKWTGNMPHKYNDDNDVSNIQEGFVCEPQPNKTKSIDIFDKSKYEGCAPAAFEDFDEELCNEPIVLITNDRCCCDQDSSDDPDSINDDNFSHVTKICVPAIIETKYTIIDDSRVQQINNENLSSSRETLIAHDNKIDEREINNGTHDDDETNKDRPLPPESSPPTSCSPVPPPLPERKQPPLPINQESYIIASTEKTTLEEYDGLPPALPNSKPPEPSSFNTAPSKSAEVPKFTMRKSKPLVKTSSLRLSFNEQVRPSDIGKVNKLISRFEQPGTKSFDRSKIIITRQRSQHSVDYSDNELEEIENQTPGYEVEDFNQISTLKTIDSAKEPSTLKNENTSSTRDNNSTHLEKIKLLKIPEINVPATDNDQNNMKLTKSSKSTLERHFSDIPKTTYNSERKNLDCSRLGHESPLPIPSQLLGVTKITTESERKYLQYQLEYQQRYTRRSRRSMTRDDENFYSFDSDEENSYYSMSPSGSSRFVVDI